jgi:hypothetical protein
MSGKSKTPEEFSPEVEALYRAINEEDDYPCVLLCASFLEQALGTLLRAAMVDCQQSSDLLDPGRGPLGSLGARSSAAYCLGLIPARMRQNLDLVRRIRNQFAHSYTGGRFADTDVRDRCMSLHLPEAELAFTVPSDWSPSTPPWESDPRSRFTYVVMMIANRLILTALSESRRTIGMAPGGEWVGDSS